MDERAVAAVATLDDPVRRRLYQHVRAAPSPVTRESAAAAAGISRKLAAFHLDKLVEVGLLRSGFGEGPRRVGRAPRIYEPAPADISVRVPERAPEVLAEILVAAVIGERAGEPARDGALRIAREQGERHGAAVRGQRRPGRVGAERALALGTDVLAEAGYEPYRHGDGVRLRNCPFHPIAALEPSFVCGLNRAYLAGVVDGLGAGGRVAAELAPAPGQCCVELRPTGRRDAGPPA